MAQVDISIYICVNDGSKDGSLEILWEYTRQHPNVRVIDKKNEGVATTRNTGLDAARGDYIWFVDADDLIQDNILAELKKISLQDSNDRIEVECYTFREYLTEQEIHAIKTHSLPINSRYYDSVVTHSLFKREFLLKHDIRFRYPDVTNSEDTIFMYEFNLTNPNKVVVNRPYYLYRERAFSLTTSKTPEAIERQRVSYMTNTLTMKKYYDQQAGDRTITANLLMFCLWREMNILASLPIKQANVYLRELKQKGLYPFKKPEACNTTRSYETARIDAIGRIYDCVYMNLSTRWGYWSMRALRFAMRVKHRVFGS